MFWIKRNSSEYLWILIMCHAACRMLCITQSLKRSNNDLLYDSFQSVMRNKNAGYKVDAQLKRLSH